MFVYASLSAVCISKNTHPDFCLSSFIANSQHLAAVTQLMQILTTHLPKQEFRCPIPLSSNTTHTFTANGFHAKAFSQPSGTIFSGRFHSYKYFDGSPALRMLQERIRFSPKIDPMIRDMYLTDEEAVAVVRSEQSIVDASVVCVCVNKDTLVNRSDYYLAAMNRFQHQLHSGRKTPIFMVFDEPLPHSDNSSLSSLQSHLQFNNDSVMWMISARKNSPNYSSESQWLRRVSQCKQLIISGSTLSWWTAWAAGLEAKVFSPPATLAHFNLPRWTVV